MLIRVDFMDLQDPLSVLSGFCRSDRAIHVGFRYNDHYLTLPKNERSSWRGAAAAEAVVQKYIIYSYGVDAPDHDPALLSLLGEGHVVDGPTKLFLTDLSSVVGIRPRRVSCVGVVSTLLRAAGLAVDAYTAPELRRQLEQNHCCWKIK